MYPAPKAPQNPIKSGFIATSDNFYHENSREDSIAYSPFNPANANGLYVVGKLYADQAYCNATAAQKLVLSVLTDFCGSDFAKRHNNQINLRNWAIANRTDGLLNPVQISRHIQALKELNLISVNTEDGQRWISVKQERQADEKFIPIFALKDVKLTYSEALMLSILTNAACIYARSDIGFVLPANTVKNISKMLIQTKSLSANTVKANLQSLEDKSLVTRDEANSGAYIVNSLIAERYACLFKVDSSEKATYLLNKRALDNVISYVDNPYTRIIRAQRSELISSDRHPVDVINTYSGTVVIEGTHYIDIDGSMQELDSSLPFYEKTLSQHIVPRNNETYTAAQTTTVFNCRYNEIERSQFYSLNDLEQWHITLDEALDDHDLSKEASEPKSFSSKQLKQIVLNGVVGQETKKRFKAQSSKNVQGPFKKSASTSQKTQCDSQKTSHIKNVIKNDSKNEIKNAAHSVECARCNEVASIALRDSNSVAADGASNESVNANLTGALALEHAIKALIESGKNVKIRSPFYKPDSTGKSLECELTPAFKEYTPKATSNNDSGSASGERISSAAKAFEEPSISEIESFKAAVKAMVKTRDERSNEASSISEFMNQFSKHSEG